MNPMIVQYRPPGLVSAGLVLVIPHTGLSLVCYTCDMSGQPQRTGRTWIVSTVTEDKPSYRLIRTIA